MKALLHDFLTNHDAELGTNLCVRWKYKLWKSKSEHREGGQVGEQRNFNQHHLNLLPPPFPLCVSLSGFCVSLHRLNRAASLFKCRGCVHLVAGHFSAAGNDRPLGCCASNTGACLPSSGQTVKITKRRKRLHILWRAEEGQEIKN